MIENDNKSLNAYPWKFTWVRRKYDLLSGSQIYNMREFLDEVSREQIDANLELNNWEHSLEDQLYIVPNLSSPIEHYPEQYPEQYPLEKKLMI